jgi:membrane-associated phospholipid phosphatase
VSRPSFRLLPHEVAFGAYLALTWARLAAATGLGGKDALLYLGLLVANGAVLAWASRSGTNLRWRVRLLFYPVAMNVCFAAMATAVPAFHPGTADDLLRGIDDALLGTTPAVALEPLVCRPLTEAMSLCYLLFFPNLAFAILYYLCGDLALLKRFFAGLFTLYGIGFLGYTLLPAKGPFLARAADFHAPLEGWILTRWNAELVAFGSNGVDVFPSLHCAISSYILLFDRRHKPWRFRIYAVPCVGLWISTVYLRYHYAIDLAAGFALAAFCLWIAFRTAPPEKEPAP